ncbi:MurR/RpiR family transcriptional regulator [Microbacterium sp. NPDC028030]|uniref:MurR/RpiR family transcriptional regulator n=1 Tax=Microbacterium sp. NPDC028030 TaxID=3155124 RepID=UPI0033E8ED56
MNVRIAEPPIGGTIDHILSVLPSLIPSAQRVARICAERPEDVVEMSGADLAAAAETSPPTVSRTCQALGFQGFQHLRMLLVRDLGAAARASRSRETGTSGWLQGIADGAGEILRTSLASVDAAAFESAADAIVAAPRVLLVGTGASGPAAQGIALKLTINGRPCEAPADGVSQQLTARVLRPGDVCVVVSSSGANVVTLAAAAAAREAGATVVGVTSFSRSELAKYADILLVAGARFQSWDQGAVGAGLVQYLLLSVLQLAVADRMDGDDDTERVHWAIRDELGALVAESTDGAEVEETETDGDVS